MDIDLKEQKPTFGRHEKFVFRYGWLKKGDDAVESEPLIFSHDEAQDTLLVACALPSGVNGWRRLQVEAAELLPQVNQPQLISLLQCAIDTADGDSALESVMASLPSRSARTSSEYFRVDLEESCRLVWKRSYHDFFSY